MCSPHRSLHTVGLLIVLPPPPPPCTPSPRILLLRYKDDPTIFSWGLLNEPRCAVSEVRRRHAAPGAAGRAVMLAAGRLAGRPTRAGGRCSPTRRRSPHVPRCWEIGLRRWRSMSRASTAGTWSRSERKVRHPPAAPLPLGSAAAGAAHRACWPAARLPADTAMHALCRLLGPKGRLQGTQPGRALLRLGVAGRAGLPQGPRQPPHRLCYRAPVRELRRPAPEPAPLNPRRRVWAGGRHRWRWWAGRGAHEAGGAPERSRRPPTAAELRYAALPSPLRPPQVSRSLPHAPHMHPLLWQVARQLERPQGRSLPEGVAGEAHAGRCQRAEEAAAAGGVSAACSAVAGAAAAAAARACAARQ